MRRDTLKVRELKVFAHHGVFYEENIDGQNFYVNLDACFDMTAAGATDDLDKTVNYSTLCDFICEWMNENTYSLIEAVAYNLGRVIMKNYSVIRKLTLEIRKPEAPINHEFGSVSAEIVFERTRAFLSLGSNMGDRRAYIEKALKLLKETDGISLVNESSVIETVPYGKTDQDNFLNQAVEISTVLSPRELLMAVHNIENACDRVRHEHWGPRTLDIDILFYGNTILNESYLQIPHPDIINREFVLRPMCEIAPYFVHPARGLTMKDMLGMLDDRGL